MTPHPLYDPDGTLWNIAIATGPDSKGESTNIWRYVIFKVSPPKTEQEFKNPWLNLEIIAEIGSSRPYSISYMHSFFVTENYVVFTEQPWIKTNDGFDFLKSGCQTPTERQSADCPDGTTPPSNHNSRQCYDECGRPIPLRSCFVSSI